jgi:hypothetical protein
VICHESEAFFLWAKTFMEKGFDPDFHLGAWSKPNTTARHYRLTSL